MLTQSAIQKWAAVHGFTAAYCCLPGDTEGVPEECETLVLLVRAYHPGGKLVDRFYPASNAAYHEAGKMVAEIQKNGGKAWKLSNLNLKKICTAFAEFGRGKNTLNYLPGIGSRFCLELIGLGEKTEPGGESAPSDYKVSFSRICESCGLCAKACPMGAISEDGFKRENCLRNYMLSGKPVPEEFRSHFGNGEAMGVIGCDICQRVCPMNRNVEENRTEDEEFSLQELLECSEETRKRFGELYGDNYAIRNRIIGQAVLADIHTDLQPEPGLKESASPLIREYARWTEENRKS